MLGATAAIVLQGCATNPAACDPNRQGGFLTTARCIGMYDRRQEDLGKQIVAEKSLNGSLQDMLASINTEKAVVAGERGNREAELATLNRSWGNLKTSLEARAQTNTELKGRTDTLQKKMDAVNATQGLSQTEKQQRLDSLHRQVNLLMSEMEAGFY